MILYPEMRLGAMRFALIARLEQFDELSHYAIVDGLDIAILMSSLE